MVSDKVPFSKQDVTYFLSYKDVKKLNPYTYSFYKWEHIEKKFDKTKCKSFLVNDEKYLEKNNEI